MERRQMKTLAGVFFGLSALAILPLVLLVPASIASAFGADGLGQFLAIPHLIVGGVLYLVGIRNGLVDTGGGWSSLNVVGILLIYVLPSIVFFWTGWEINKD